MIFNNQKNDLPPHLKRCGLNGTRFLDARESPYSKECGFQDSRHKKIKNAILSKPYSFYFIFVFFLYLFFNIWINKLYITYGVLIDNFYYGVSLVFLMILVAFLTALNVNLIIIKFEEYKEFNYKSGGFTSIAVFLGFMGGACPGCIVGLFPAFSGIFLGSGLSLNVLPLKGIELQILSVILLILSANILSKESVCNVRNVENLTIYGEVVSEHPKKFPFERKIADQTSAFRQRWRFFGNFF